MKTYLRIATCLSLLYALIYISDVGALIALRVIIFLVAQIFIGGCAYNLLSSNSKSGQQNLLPTIGIGFVLGAVVFVAVDQAVISFRLAEQVWYSSVVALLILGVYLNRKKLSIEKTSAVLEEISPKTIILLTTLSLSLLLSSWFWLIPAWLFLIVGSMLIAVIDAPSMKVKFFGSASILLGVALMIDQSRKRPEFWSVHHLHYQFDEALNISFSKYGIFENMMAVGEPLNYHWFSHAWIGMLSRLTGADDWVVSTRVTPLIVGLLISCLAFAIGKKLTTSVSGGLTVAAVFAVSPVFHVISPEISWVMTTSHSQFFGIVFVLAFVFIFIDFGVHPTMGNTILMSIILAATTITKVNHAVILAVGVSAATLVAITRNQAGRLRLFGHYLVVIIPTGLSYLLSQSLKSSSGARIGFIPLAAQMSGDFKNMVSVRRELIAIYFLLGVFGLAITVTITSLTRSIAFDNPFIILAAGSVLTGLVVALLFDFGVDGRQVYFWHSASIFVWLIAGYLFYQTFISDRKIYSRRSFVWISGLSAFVFLTLNALPNLDSGSDVAALLRSTSSNSAVIFPLILGAVLVFKYLALRRLKKSNERMYCDYLIFSIVATSIIFFITTHFSRFNDDYRSVRSESADIVVPADLQLVGNWFAENTQDDIIVASNSFCESSNCTESNLKVFSTTGDPEYRLSGSSTDYRMSIAIKRRFLITSFTFLTTDGKLPEWAVDRIRLTRDFGSTPTQELLTQLRDFDVRYFVSDADVGNVSNWIPFGSVVYEAGSYKVIDLGLSS